MKLYRRMWRWGLAWRFRLFHRHRYRSLIMEWVEGKPFVVLPDVFNPGLFRTSGFLVQQFQQHLPDGATILDMGTGTGIGAIFAAQQAQHVTAVDINPEAIRAAQINVLINHMEGCIEIKQSDLFNAVRNQRFDVILFNPPYFRGEPQDAHDFAWRSDNTVERFAASLSEHLTPNGFGLIVLSSDGDHDTFIDIFRSQGVKTVPVAQRDLVNEILTVYKLTVTT